MKKIMALILMLVLSVSMLSLGVFSQENTLAQNTDNEETEEPTLLSVEDTPTPELTSEEIQTQVILEETITDKDITNERLRDRLAKAGVESTQISNAIQIRLQKCKDYVSNKFPEFENVEGKCSEIIRNDALCERKLIEGGVLKEKAIAACDNYIATPILAAANIRDRVQALQGKFNEKVDERMIRINANEQLTEEQKTKMIENMEKFQNWGDDKLEKLDTAAMYRLKNLEQARLDKIKDLSKEDVEKFVGLDRATQEKIISMNKEQIQAKLNDFKIKTVAKKEELFMNREVNKQMVEKYKKVYQDAKKSFDENKKELQNLKQNFLKLKNENSEEAIQAAKDYMTTAVNIIIDELNVILSKTLENDDLTEDEVANIQEKINEKISSLNELKEKIASATTKEEIKQIAIDIDNRWKIIKDNIRVAQDAIKNSKIGEVIVRSKYLEIKLDRILSNMEERGVDTSIVDDKVTKFSEKIASAKDKYEQAKIVINEILNLKTYNVSTNINTQREKINALMTDAHGDLKEAQEILKDIASVLKENGETLESENEEGKITIVTETENKTISEELINEDNLNNTEVEGTL